MSGNDIRNIMNLMEAAVNPVVEAPEPAPVDERAKKITDDLLVAIKGAFDEYGSASIDGGSINDDIYNHFEGRQDDYDYLSKVAPFGGRVSSSTEWKWLNGEFKARFGTSMRDYAEKVDDAKDKADAASIKSNDKPVWDHLSYLLTVKATPKWAAENLKFYKSGAKLVAIEYDGSNLPLAVFGQNAYTHLKMDQETLAQWFLDHGIQQMKRPVRKRSGGGSYYD